jgi:16S rRNA (guanine966-N2)-methyltransferase
VSLRIYGNRQLKTLPGLETRPTPGMVRQALFNIWQGQVVGSRWLDLCAGSGAIGAEALCRGATLVVGIEQADPSCAVIQQNWKQVAKPSQKFRVVRGEVPQRLESLRGQQFDRIYCDPPYASDLHESVLVAIVQLQLLAIGGEVAMEHSSKRMEILAPPALTVCRRKVYGSTALTFYCLAAVGAA